SRHPRGNTAPRWGGRAGGLPFLLAGLLAGPAPRPAAWALLPGPCSLAPFRGGRWALGRPDDACQNAIFASPCGLAPYGWPPYSWPLRWARAAQRQKLAGQGVRACQWVPSCCIRAAIADLADAAGADAGVAQG